MKLLKNIDGTQKKIFDWKAKEPEMIYSWTEIKLELN